jgi:tripartite-type tricarboxylate transporter receptor subunit TctC
MHPKPPLAARRHLLALAAALPYSALRAPGALGGLGGLASLSGRAHAQGTFPTRAMTMVVPYTAGGASDMGARLLAPDMGRLLNQNMVVDNVGGAGGSLGVQKFLAAPPDGHTMLYGSLSEAILVPAINPATPYKADDLLPVALAGKTPVVFVARKEFPANNLDELIALARRSPGRLTYGSPGIGTFQHVMAETLKERAGIFMVHIPYRGGQQIVSDVMGGQVDLGVTTVPNVAPLVATGRLKALGVSSSARVAALPDVRSFGDTPALKGLDLQTWGMVFVHARTPDAVVARLNAAVNEVLQLPAVREARLKAGSELSAPLSPAAALAFYRAERDTYKPIARRIKPE